MTTRINPDGTIEVRVVLYVTVDPAAWAQNMMGEHPDEVTSREVRAHVKEFASDVVYGEHLKSCRHSDIDPVPITGVVLETPYVKEGR